jgi:TetR/AcrR family transcriptional regulator
MAAARKKPGIAGPAPRKNVPTRERRRQILDAAARLFAAGGFAGTTTRQIASAVGISETVLFRHFPSKQDLYSAILEDRMPATGFEQWLGALRGPADRRDDEALFASVVKAILRSYRDDAVSHRLVLFAALEGHELARLFQVTYSAPVHGFLREYVSRRQAEGAFRAGRPEVFVHMVLGAAAHFAQWNALGVNPLGLTEDDVAAHVRTLLAGIRAPAGDRRAARAR